MRKAILAGLLAATLVPGLAQAQSSGELRHDRREIRDEQRDVNRAIRNGAPAHVVRAEQRDVRQARQEYREDWRDHRRSNPNVYRGGSWNAPRGYNYRRIAVGHRFQPVFYGQRYWVDPYRYHLRPVGMGQRWVRYGNDVVLINTRTGRVVDINYGFFF
jgi:Ni/Co efflux regulator RcnB